MILSLLKSLPGVRITRLVGIGRVRSLLDWQLPKVIVGAGHSHWVRLPLYVPSKQHNMLIPTWYGDDRTAVPIGLSLYAPPVQTRLALFVSYLNPSEDSEEEETYISVIEAKLRADAQFGQDAEGVPMDFLRKHDEGFSITQSSEVGREFDGTCRLHCGTGNTGDCMCTFSFSKA